MSTPISPSLLIKIDPTDTLWYGIHNDNMQRLNDVLLKLENLLDVNKAEIDTDDMLYWDGSEYRGLTANAEDFNVSSDELSIKPPYGDTASRPGSPRDGEPYFDTDLGKPIWWDGSAWVYADGTAV